MINYLILTSTVNRGKIYKSMEYDKENAHMLAYWELNLHKIIA